MNTPQTEASMIARETFEHDGKGPLHKKLILWVLEKHGPQTNYGIAKNSYHKKPDKWGNLQTYMLNYYAVARRTSELVRDKKIVALGLTTDSDGAVRTLYRLK